MIRVLTLNGPPGVGAAGTGNIQKMLAAETAMPAAVILATSDNQSRRAETKKAATAPAAGTMKNPPAVPNIPAATARTRAIIETIRMCLTRENEEMPTASVAIHSIHGICGNIMGIFP